MKSTLIILGCIFAIFSFLPLIRTPLWWIRVLDFPRLHVAVLLVIIELAYIYFFGVNSTAEIAMVTIWTLAILNEIRYVYNFTPLSKVEALRAERKEADNTFTMMIANVRMANTKYQKFVELVLKENPDILLMNEPGDAWHENVRHEFDKLFPYSIKKPINNTYGMLFWSKFKLHNSEIRFLVENDIPSFYTIIELPSGKKFDLFTVHPQPPRLLRNTETREAELLLVAKMAKATPHASVVAGDLNDVAWSNTTKLFKNISGMLDPRVGRGFFNTYSAYVPLFRYPLDHVFYEPAFRLVGLQRLPKFGSDHFPISITLSYEPQLESQQETPVADTEEKKEAEELIEEGLEKGKEMNEEDKA